VLLDPFVGRGTTLAAALDNGTTKVIGIDSATEQAVGPLHTVAVGKGEFPTSAMPIGVVKWKPGLGYWPPNCDFRRNHRRPSIV
jgi:hypothetical protein